MPGGSAKLAGKLAPARMPIRRRKPGCEADFASRRRLVAAAADAAAADEAGLKNPTPKQLRNLDWFTMAALLLNSSQVQRALDLYKSGTKAGLGLSPLPASRARSFAWARGPPPLAPTSRLRPSTC